MFDIWFYTSLYIAITAMHKLQMAKLFHFNFRKVAISCKMVVAEVYCVKSYGVLPSQS